MCGQAAAGLLGGACLKSQRTSYELCLPRAQTEGTSGSTRLCTVPRARSGGGRLEPLPRLGDAGGCTRLNTAFRCKLLSSTLDVAAHCDGQGGEDVSDFCKLPWLKD